MESYDFLKLKRLVPECEGAENIGHFSHHVLAVSLTAKSAKNGKETGQDRLPAGETTRALSLLCAHPHRIAC